MFLFCEICKKNAGHKCSVTEYRRNEVELPQSGDRPRIQPGIEKGVTVNGTERMTFRVVGDNAGQICG